jgi:hypothetical protein
MNGPGNEMVNTMSEKEREKQPPGPERSESEPDALKSFLEQQGRKCAVHHQAHTAEVLELIRKHRKNG